VVRISTRSKHHHRRRNETLAFSQGAAAHATLRTRRAYPSKFVYPISRIARPSSIALSVHCLLTQSSHRPSLLRRCAPECAMNAALSDIQPETYVRIVIDEVRFRSTEGHHIDGCMDDVGIFIGQETHHAQSSPHAGFVGCYQYACTHWIAGYRTGSRISAS